METSNGWRPKEGQAELRADTFQHRPCGSSFSTARMEKAQETQPNKELLKELDIFSLEKNRLRRQRSSVLEYLICSPGKRDETLPDKPEGRVHVRAKELL